jgi:hypothetical protein
MPALDEKRSLASSIGKPRVRLKPSRDELAHTQGTAGRSSKLRTVVKCLGRVGGKVVARSIGGLVAMALLVCCLPPAAWGQDSLDTRITSSPANLHRSTAATFTFEGRVGEGEWGSCVYDPDQNTFVCETEFECSLDGQPWAPCRPALTVRGLSDGYHVFAVRSVEDGAVDLSPATRSFRVRYTGDECFRALEGVENAEAQVKDVVEVVSIHRDKIRAAKREVRSATGLDLEHAREKLKQVREHQRELQRYLRETRAALEAAQAHRDAACGG